MNNDEFEAALSRMRPRSAGVQRDRVMYLAGRASREAAGNRWRPQTVATAAGWLLAAGFCGLWLQRPEPVVVAKVEYVERVVEPESVAPSATSDSTERVPRVLAQGRAGDLDVLIASSLRRNRREQGTTRPANQGPERTGLLQHRPDDSYMALRKSYLESPEAGSLAGEQL